MAQRSITSFFKLTPPKPTVKREKDDEEEIKVNGDAKGDKSPVTNGKAKVHLSIHNHHSSIYPGRTMQHRDYILILISLDSP